MISRRSFVKHSGLISLGLLSAQQGFSQLISGNKIPAIGIQLYMVRDDMAKDPKGTLSRLGKMGYTQLESYNGDKGVFWGYSNLAFSRLAQEYGLTLVSSHYEGDTAGYEKTAAQAAEIGMKYLIYPWKGPQKSIDDFKKIAGEFNGYGEICRKNGIRFGYHPHDYPYKPVDGELPIKVLLDHTDPALVDYEMDFYYTVTEGQDPESLIRKYSPRFRLCHMRDVLKERLPKGSEEESACDLGTGIMNYPQLLNTAIENGMQYFFVEQSRLFHETALESAGINAAYLKNI